MTPAQRDLVDAIRDLRGAAECALYEATHEFDWKALRSLGRAMKRVENAVIALDSEKVKR